MRWLLAMWYQSHCNVGKVQRIGIVCFRKLYYSRWHLSPYSSSVTPVCETRHELIRLARTREMLIAFQIGKPWKTYCIRGYSLCVRSSFDLEFRYLDGLHERVLFFLSLSLWGNEMQIDKSKCLVLRRTS